MTDDKTRCVGASLHIELNVECPYCEDYFDLLSIEGLNDEGELLQVACPSKGHWSESHEKFDLKTDCPSCNRNIHISNIAW